jgi:syntaxin 7
VKKPEPAVEPEKLALALAVVAADGEADAAKENDVDDGAVATVVKKKKGPKKGPKKEKNPPPAKNVAAKKKPGRKPAAATAAAAGKKVTAMGKAAAIAKDGLKRPASQFVVNEDPSEHASFKKHAGARPAKRQAREQLHSRFDAAASPEEPPVPRAWPTSDKASPVIALPKKGTGGRYAKLAEAAAAAAARAKKVIGSEGENLPAGKPNGAWSSAYRTLQAAHIKLQTKYDKLKETKLHGFLDEAETYRTELAEHGSKAEELVNHFRMEAQREREGAAEAQKFAQKAYELERENNELKETLLAYQGKMLRMEQDMMEKEDALMERFKEEASASGRDGAWGPEEFEAFTGLRWTKQSTGIHQFRHAATGFVFQLSAAEPEEGAGGGNATAADDEVSFTPIEYGIANGLLPGYLSSAIDFEKRELPGFVGRMLAVLNQVVAQRGAGH